MLPTETATESQEKSPEMNGKKRNLLIVSNRLPLSVKRVEGTYQSTVSSGGLVTSLSGLTKSTEFRWLGWPGLEVRDPEDQKKVNESLAEHRAVALFLEEQLAHDHYNGFSSKKHSFFNSQFA